MYVVDLAKALHAHGSLSSAVALELALRSAAYNLGTLGEITDPDDFGPAEYADHP